jgi:hypothetical protein
VKPARFFFSASGAAEEVQGFFLQGFSGEAIPLVFAGKVAGSKGFPARLDNYGAGQSADAFWVKVWFRYH